MPQKIGPRDGETDRRQKEVPPLWKTVQGEGERPLPQRGMRRPSAPARLGPNGADSDFQGMMEKAEQNQQLEAISVM